ncbi:hypothetical protein ATCV1_z442R [Acanthocystis turfacea chlorella virus 1]|uniref:Uncharacterized protein z442R n=1 Tax=Chlorovirus heliozoae TaxID=322019 RepID=A7K952_9PHYC|nr:hypothetical protein ATCV1_z442R [Acanthocystis turfacea chlorella virus 1]ABT16576.1 hypothetical protein ATCV1_z442R [Acanthocystis turfacea chlorella virus 1]
MTCCNTVVPDVPDVVVNPINTVHMAVCRLPAAIRTVAISKGVVVVLGQLEILVHVFGLVDFIRFVFYVVPLVRLIARSSVHVRNVETPHDEHRRVARPLRPHAFIARWDNIFSYKTLLWI